MDKKKNRFPWFLICIVFIIGVLVSNYTPTIVSAVTDKNYENLKIFSDVLFTVQKDYVEETKVDDLIEGAIQGMLMTLDPHSSYMPPDMYREMQVETKGSFGGLGIELTIKDGILTVVAPIEDTPAFLMGIKAGDQIIAIEGKSTKNINIMEAVKKLRGKKGTKVTISIMREGLTVPQDVTIVRDVIEIKSVKSKVLNDRIGYIRVTQFQEQTSRDFHAAMENFAKEVPDPLGLILDFRNNPGGLLQQAVEVSDEFIDSGLIVYTEGRSENQEMQFKAHQNAKKYEYPIIVLVNAGTASGSEIVAGALQDHGLAVILGTTTFGKGSVQTVIPLENGGGIRLTTAKYFTPKGRLIHAKGIEPDIVVEDSIEVLEKNDRRIRFIREKDLQEHLDKEEEPAPVDGEEEPAPVNGVKEPGAEDEAETAEPAEKEKGELPDPPLDRAIELIKSWNIFQGKQDAA